jgi:hypothetical protein
MAAILVHADSLLRGRFASVAALPRLHRRSLAAEIVLGGAIYGAAMGSFGGLADDRLWQVAYSAAKVPLLLLATWLLSLPSFYVFNTLAGLQRDFGRALAALLSAQAAVAIVLASLAPLVAVWNLSSDNYRLTILFNGLLFLVASLAAQGVLRRHYRPLIAAAPRHRRMLQAWLVLYGFVGIQMGWMLRPFVGDPGSPVRFFRRETWGNAYLVVFELLVSALR